MLILKNEITYSYISTFLSEKLKNRDPLLQEMEEYARKTHIPVIQPESARLLETLCCLLKPGRILEIGTAIGYSAILMAKTLDEEGMVETIDIDEDMLVSAHQYIRRAGMEKRIRLVQGDALEVLSCLSTPYDLIFLDAAKGRYPDFLPHCLRLLVKGGLFISDNVLYRGRVAQSGFLEHKHRTITVRLKAYLDNLCAMENLVTSIVPVGDGMTISFRKE